MPLAGPGSVPVHSTWPFSSSYARTLRSPPATNTIPALVTTIPLRAPTPPVLAGPPAAKVAGSSPIGTCHLIVPAFRSYAVSVVYGGLVADAMTPYSVTYRAGGTFMPSGYGTFPPVPPTPPYVGGGSVGRMRGGSRTPPDATTGPGGNPSSVGPFRP